MFQQQGRFIFPALLLAVAPVFVVSASVLAADAVADTSLSYKDDRIILTGDTLATLRDGKEVCLRRGTRLVGVGSDGSKDIFSLIDPGGPFLSYDCKDEGMCNVACRDEAGVAGKPLHEGTTLAIERAATVKVKPARYGLTYGVLVVPFKFQLSGDNEFTGSATAGPYLGYRFPVESYRSSLTVAIFAGASNVAVDEKKTTNSGTDTDTEQKAAFGYGAAAILEIPGGFQSGIVLGSDVAGDGSDFEYNNKPWLAIEIGYSFSQGWTPAR